jgi:uncharacterized membrane protein YGL010W
MSTSNSNSFAIGCSMVGTLLLFVSLLVHSLTDEFTGLYFFSLGLFVVGFIIEMSENK